MTEILPKDGELERNAANVAAATSFNLLFNGARKRALAGAHIFGPVEIHQSVIHTVTLTIDPLKAHIGLEAEFDDMMKILRCYFIPLSRHGETIIKLMKAEAARMDKAAKKAAVKRRARA